MGASKVTYFRRLVPAALLLAGTAHAQSFEDVAALDMRVAAALGAHAGEPGGAARPIDRRLKLAACPQPASIEAPAMGAVTVRCEALGWRIRVPLLVQQAALATRDAAVKAEPLVRRGDQVELTASTGSFTVSTIGIAEQDGAPGDRIRIRSDRKGPPVIGIVGEDGTISLPGFKQ
jgi:flagella basal body P-ring formation protein FlgA